MRRVVINNRLLVVMILKRETDRQRLRQRLRQTQRETDRQTETESYKP